MVSVCYFFYHSKLGFSNSQIGLLLTLTLAGDTIISQWITTKTNINGRRMMFILSAALMLFAGVMFICIKNYIFLVASSIIGVISPSGGEIGPFLSIEQSALSQIVSDKKRTHVFASYNLCGSFATAFGALVGGWSTKYLQSLGFNEITAYKIIIIFYSISGLILIFLFILLTPKIEALDPEIRSNFKTILGLHKSNKIVLNLILFLHDTFTEGFVIQSFLIYWFHKKFNLDNWFTW